MTEEKEKKAYEEYEKEMLKENEKFKQLIDIAKIIIKILENTNDNIEEVFCLEKLKELLGDTK
jgi:hypothetical protein